jgi:signal peptide peptidase SppA
MPAIPVHKTPTDDGAWDGPAMDARCPADRVALRASHAWVDGATDPDLKGSYKFGHHFIGTDGTVGAASTVASSTGIGYLNRPAGSPGRPDIPDGDRQGVWEHLAGHLSDANEGDPQYEPPPLTGQADESLPAASIVTPRSYSHVTKALFERAWAVQPHMLTFMADLLRFRSAGGSPTVDEIAERLAGARAQNGDRAGGAKVGPVAVIPMYGIISQRQSLMSDTSGGTSIDELRNALRAALGDRSISAIVFDIDSPGGSVDGVPEFAAELRAARGGSKPIVGQVNTLAASAAYWLAAQMTEIVATPSGEVGSIGVFAMHEDVSVAAEMAGVKTTLVSAGPFKTEGNQFEPLSDTAREAIQGQVDDFYGMFVGDVARGRRVTVDKVSADYGQGRTLLARTALAAGMVDRIGTLEDTVSRLQPKVSPASAGRAQGHPVPITASIARPDRGWNQRMKGKRS